MIKSQLRKIIRESIKELMTEQQIHVGSALNYDQNNPAHQSMMFYVCGPEYVNQYGMATPIADNSTCCTGVGIGYSGAQHGTGGSGDITTDNNGFWWNAIQHHPNSPAPYGFYADFNTCKNNCSACSQPTPLTPQQQFDIANMQKDTPPTSGGPFSGTKPPVSGPQAKRMPKSQPIRRKR